MKSLREKLLDDLLDDMRKLEGLEEGAPDQFLGELGLKPQVMLDAANRVLDRAIEKKRKPQ